MCNTHTHIAYLHAHIHLPASIHMHTIERNFLECKLPSLGLASFLREVCP